VTLSVNGQHTINEPYDINPYIVGGFNSSYSQDLITKNKVNHLCCKSCIDDKKGKSDTVTIWETKFNKTGNPVLTKFYFDNITVVINFFYDDLDRLSIYNESEIFHKEKTETTVLYCYNEQNRLIKQAVSTTESYLGRKIKEQSTTYTIFDFEYNDTTRKTSICLTSVDDDNSKYVSKNYISWSFDSLFLTREREDVTYDGAGNITEEKVRRHPIIFADSCGYGDEYTLKYYYENGNRIARIDEYSCKNKLTNTTLYSYDSNGLLNYVKSSNTKDFDLYVYDYWND
jgi:hypothetical protein